MAQFEANQKRIHITKLFFSNGRVEAEFKTKKGNSFVTDSKEDSLRRNSSVTKSKVCRQYSSLISQVERDSKKNSVTKNISSNGRFKIDISVEKSGILVP